MIYTDLTKSMQRQRALVWPKLLFYYLGLALLILTLTRFVFMSWQYQRVMASDGFWFILLQGVRFDLVTLGLLFVIPLSLTPILVSRFPKLKYFLLNLLKWYVWLVMGVLILMELLTPLFINQFDTRPNHLLIDAMLNSEDGLLNLFKEHVFFLVMSLSVLVGALYTLKLFLNKKTDQASWAISFEKKTALIVALGTLLTSLILIHSRVSLQSINPSHAAYSTDPLMNTMALNSTYSLMYTLFDKTDEKNNEHSPVALDFPAD